MDQGPAIISGNLRGFFSDLLVEAAGNQKMEMPATVQNYVLDLLVSFQEAANLFVQKEVRVPVLADMLAEALEADFRRKVLLLRHLGDTSLMVSGFFPEALSRRAVDLEYYQRMGEIAYSNLGAMTNESNVFEELSSKFVKVTRLLNEVSDQTYQKDFSVLKLLEFYMNTGSEHVLEKLKKQGIIPIHSLAKPEKKTILDP